MVEYLKLAFDRGLRKVQLLCGAEEYEYKFANANGDLAVYVVAGTPFGRLALAVNEWRDQRHAGACRRSCMRCNPKTPDHR